MSVVVTVPKFMFGASASTLKWISSFLCSAPWSLLGSSWSGGCLATSGSSLVCWSLLLQTTAGSQSQALLVCLGTSLLDIWVCPSLALLVSDSLCWCGESATTSAGLSDASVLDLVDSSSLNIRRGNNRKLSVLTWGLQLRHLRAASL